MGGGREEKREERKGRGCWVEKMGEAGEEGQGAKSQRRLSFEEAFERLRTQIRRLLCCVQRAGEKMRKKKKIERGKGMSGSFTEIINEICFNILKIIGQIFKLLFNVFCRCWEEELVFPSNSIGTGLKVVQLYPDYFSINNNNKMTLHNNNNNY